MSFFNSKPWAKIPTDLLENKAMIQAEKELGDELRAAPVLLYLAGATKADEDGVFDIGDGREFAALIKSKSPEIVQQVASVMTKYRIFAHVPNSPVYLFAEWEYSTRQNGKSLKNRFAIACECWKKKQEEDSYFCPQYTKLDTMRKNLESTSVECSNTIQPRVNECLNTIRGGENGNPQIRREQIREDEIRANQIIPEVEQTTHTRVEGVEEEKQPEPSEPLIGSTGSGLEKILDESQIPEEQERLMTIPDWSIVPENETSEALKTDDSITEKGDASFVPDVAEKKQGEAGDVEEIAEILNEFFRNNNAVYNEAKGSGTIESIARELLAGTGDIVKAADLARKMCYEFKQMHDSPKGDRWHNIPLFPKYMLKEAVWAQLVSRVSAIYGTPSEPKLLNCVKQAQKDYEEHVAELEGQGMNALDAEYIRAGIDPADPARAQKLLIYKSRGK